MELTGKIALVTGGAHRIGKAITLMLAEAGVHVVVNYHTSATAAQQTVQEAAGLGVQALAVQCDVADWSAVQAMGQTIQNRFGGVDIIVNSASYFARTTFPSSAPADIELWQRVTRTLIDGPYYVGNVLVPTLQARGGGAIVNIVDLSAWQSWRGFMAHGVGKSALLALTRQWALELAPTIRVNAVAPGLVLAPPHMSAAQQASMAEQTLLRRWGQPADVTRAVKYLLEADYITGDVITVDGGERVKR